MAYYGALWPQSIPHPGSAQAWRTVYGDQPQADVVAAVRHLAGEEGRRFGPSPGEVMGALAELRRPRPPVYAAPPAALEPSGRVARDQRRLRLIGKLAVGAVDRDGRPTEGWETDADLAAIGGEDALLADMVDAHLTERHAARARATLHNAGVRP